MDLITQYKGTLPGSVNTQVKKDHKNKKKIT